MPNNGGNITYGINFNIDKQQLNQLKTELTGLSKITAQSLVDLNPNLNLDQAKKDLIEIRKSAGQVETALSSAFNPKLGSLNINKLQSELSKLDIGKIYQDFSKAGAAGIQAFNQIPSAVMKTNLQLKESHSLLDNIGKTMTNTIKWGITSRVINGLADSIQSAWNYTVKLDTSLNDIRIVTGKSAEEMERFAVQANKAAQGLGASTRDYTNAALIYYQQGLSDEESNKRAEITVKAANVTGQSTREVSEQLTAIWNGYKVDAAEAELYIDKVAKVAATTAADLEEMASGMSKVAAAANTAGVDIDQLNAMLATVISVTREAPESIGTAFKTIFARLGDLKMGKTDEEGVSLGKVSGQLQALGVQILDETGNMREMGDIIEDIAAKWQNWTQAQKQAVAIAMAGRLQYSRFIALFENWDMYTKAIDTSRNAVGELNRENEIYLSSTKAHLQQLSTAWERVFDSFVDNKGVNSIIDVFTGATKGLANFIEALGGGGNVLLTFGGLATRVFSKQIAESIDVTIRNSQAAKYNLQQLEGVLKTLNAQQESFQKAHNGEKNAAINTRIEGMEKLRDRAKVKLINNNQIEQGRDIIEAHASAVNELDAFQKQEDLLTNRLQKYLETQGIYISQEEALKIIIDSNSEAYKDYLEAIEDNIKTIDIYEKDIKALKVAQEEYKKALDAVNRAENSSSKDKNAQIKKANEQKQKAKNKLKYAVTTVSKDVDELSNREDLSGESLKKINNLKNDILSNIKTKSNEDLKNIANDIDGIVDKSKEAMNNIKQDFTKLGDDLEQHSSDIASGVKEKIKGEVERTGNDENKFFKDIDTTATIQNFVQLTGAITQTVAGFQSLINITDIWNNKDLSVGEKILQTIMALGTGLPMVINGFITMKTATIGAATAMGVLDGVEKKTFTTALTGILSIETALGPLWLVILAITAALGTIVAVGIAISKAYDADADAAKAATEASEQAAKNFDELNTKAQQLKETISDYNEGIEQLDKLDKKSQEYKQTLEDVNKKAKELIETYKLYDQFHIENGVITFNAGALESVQAQMDSAAYRAESLKYSTQITSNRANLKSQTTDLRRDVGSAINPLGVLDDFMVPFVGGLTLMNDTISLSRQQMDNLISTLKNLKESNEEAYIIHTKDSQALSDWVKVTYQGNYEMTLLADKIGEQVEGFKSLIDTTEELNKANKYYIEQINLLAVKEIYKDFIGKMAIDKNTGKIDEARQEQLTTVINKSNIQQKAQTAKDNRRQVLDDSELNLGKTWSHEFAAAMGGRLGTAETDLNKYLDETLRNFGVSKDVVGEIKDNESLSREYAKIVLGMTDQQVAALQFANNELKDAQNNLIVDVTSAEKRGNIRAATFEAGVTQSGDTEVNTKFKNVQDAYNAVLEDTLNKADEMGNQYGVRFSDAILNSMASENGKIDVSTIFPTLGPDKIDELLAINEGENGGEKIAEMLGITDQFIAMNGEKGQEIAEKIVNGFVDGLAEAKEKWNPDDAIAAALGQKSSELDEMGDGLSKKKFQELQEDAAGYAKTLMEVADQSDKLADSVKTDAKEATNLSVQIIKMNQAINTLADNWSDWSEILKTSDKTSEEYSKALRQTRAAVGDLLDIDADAFGDGFVTSADNMALIEKAAKGDGEAIDELRQKALDNIILNMKLDFEDGSDLNNQKVLNEVHRIQEMLDANKIIMGTEVDLAGIQDGNQSLLDSLNQMIAEAGMTKDQVNNMLSGMGFTANYASQPQKVINKQPDQTITHHEITNRKKEQINGGEVESYIETTWSEVVPGKTVEGDVTAYSLETSAPGTTVVPKINSVNRMGNGSANNYSSQNKGGGSPGKSKSGGGGGSSKPSKEKPLDKKTDPYHDVNIQLALTDSKLKLVQSQTDKAFGAKKIENYNKQLQLLNNKLDQTKEKLKIAEQEQARLGNLLANRGAIFNADGTLANYEQLYQQELAKVNDMIDKYNNMSKEEQEAYKDTLDAAKEDFSKFEEQLKDYDDTVSSLIPGLQQDIQDAIDEQIELQIKKFNMEFEIHLDMTEAHKDWNEFKKKILDGIKDDDIFGNARARAIDDMSVYLDKNGNGQLAAGLKQTQEVLAELRKMDESGWSSVYGDNRTKALEDLQTAYKDIEQSMLEMQSIQEDVHQAWLDTMDEINDKMSEQVRMYEQISNIIEHDKKVIELIYGETDFDALGRIYETQHQNNLKLLDFQRMNADFWRKEMDSIVDKNSEEWKKARDNWIDAVNNLNATIENSIQNIRDKMENAIDGIFDKFNKEITNGKGLDYVEQQWDLINDKADDYLDTVNAAFGIRDIERKYQNAIDATDNVGAQRKLNELMQKELESLRNKDKLTEYDIERAQKRYDLEVKRLALEEAQNTKTKMRLRRDSQGNYRYEYIADEDNIRKLQEEVDALENSLYNFDKERFISLQNEIVGYVRDREEAIKEIQMDASLTEEERQARLAEINQLYNDLIQDVTDQTVTAQTNLYESGADELRKIWDQQGQDFNALNEEQQRIMVEEMIPQFESGVHDMIEAFKGPDGFEAQTTESMDALGQATRDYENNLREVQQTSGEVFDDVEAGIDKNIPKTQDLIEENRELNDQYQDQIDKIKELNAELDQNLTKYKGITDAAKQAATAAYDYWMTENEIAAKKAAQEKQNSQTPQINNGNQGGNANANGTTKGHNGSSGRTLNEDTMSGIAGAIWIYGSSASGWGTGNTRKARLSEKFGSDYAQQVQDYINSHQDARNWSDWQRLKNYYYSTFRSGGYTGDWGDDDGRLAVLHKKELVLNSQDTQNMLDMMKIAREVIAAAGPNALRLNSGKYQSDAATNGQLEQNVHIEANFPNVESASEIEEAINNLVNLAAQRANYKTR